MAFVLDFPIFLSVFLTMARKSESRVRRIHFPNSIPGTHICIGKVAMNCVTLADG